LNNLIKSKLLKEKINFNTKTLRGHSGWVDSLAVLPDNKLASGSSDETIKIWDLISGQCINTLKGHSGSVNSLAVLPDNKLASGSSDKTIKIWK